MVNFSVGKNLIFLIIDRRNLFGGGRRRRRTTKMLKFDIVVHDARLRHRQFLFSLSPLQLLPHSL